MIDQLIVDRVVEASNVVDVIGEFYELKKRGTAYMCLCPFHDDRRMGSFMISQRKNMYKCFSCDKQGDSVQFLRDHLGLSFEDAIKWLGNKYGIDVPGSGEVKQKPKVMMKPRTPLPRPEMLEIIYEDMVEPSFQGRENNTLVKWLHSLPWTDEMRERLPKVLQNYQIGHAPSSGRTIFWQIDEEGKVHSGKLMAYQSDGHRDKAFNPSWVHSALFNQGRVDFDKYEYVACLYGLHLIQFQPETVNIVESEKTALICATAYGDMLKSVWMATGGKSQLKKQLLQPLIDKKMHIVLWPDIDGIDEWKQKAKEIKYDRLTVADKYLMKMYSPEADGQKADIADMIIRMLTPKINEVFDKYPELKKLDKFGLELISTRRR